MRIAAIVIGVALAVVVFVFLLRTFINHVARRATTRASNDPAVAGSYLVVPALMQAGRSSSGGQWNGNGVLAFFPKEVRFIMGVPRRTMTIRRDDITDVKVTKNLKLPGIRRAGGPSYLVVEWRSPEGNRTTAFQTGQANRLLEQLRETR